MRLKEDYMQNQQLKPSYNLEIGVSDGYILNIMISQERSDFNPYIPYLEKFNTMY